MNIAATVGRGIAVLKVWFINAGSITRLLSPAGPHRTRPLVQTPDKERACRDVTGEARYERCTGAEDFHFSSIFSLARPGQDLWA